MIQRPKVGVNIARFITEKEKKTLVGKYYTASKSPWFPFQTWHRYWIGTSFIWTRSYVPFSNFDACQVGGKKIESFFFHCSDLCTHGRASNIEKLWRDVTPIGSQLLTIAQVIVICVQLRIRLLTFNHFTSSPTYTPRYRLVRWRRGSCHV